MEHITDIEADMLILKAENEKLKNEAEGMRSNWYKSVVTIKSLTAELEQVMRSLDTAMDKLKEEDGHEI